MGFLGVGSLLVDADERALLVDMQVGISGAFAVVDLVHGRFASLGERQQDGHTGNKPCTDYWGSRAWTSGWNTPPGIVSADLSTWRTSGAVVALDTGRLVALVTGDFSQDDQAIEYVIDPLTSVIVSPAGPTQPGQPGPAICAGALHRTPATPTTTVPVPAPATPRTGPALRCVTASP
jgi:hypothetical protein